MYLFGLNKYAGTDKVFTMQTTNLDIKFKTGDLIRFGEDIFLCLWKEVSFAEQYTYEYSPIWTWEVIYKWLFSTKSINLIHRLVYTYYTTYKSIVRLFLSPEIDKFLTREMQVKTKKKYSDLNIDLLSNKISFETEKNKWQQLVIFPDLWSMYNLLPEDITKKTDIALLNSTQTQNQKDKNFRKIKKWDVSTIFCTHGEMFQDFSDLKKIYLIEPHKRYYKNHQDPRYKVQDIVEEMKNIYWCEIILVYY